MSFIKISREYINDNKQYEYEYINEIANIEIDYNGNIYILYNGIYYILSLDPDNIDGIELIKINNNKYYRDIFNENKHIFKHTNIGKIVSGITTLSGKIYEQLNDMTFEEKENYSINNNYDYVDPQFTEKTYYRVFNEDNFAENDLVEDENIVFHLNGININQELKGLLLSELLIPYPSSFDTIYIDGDIISKNVVSSSERIDGYCTTRLTIYSSGFLKCNFMDKIILTKLCIDDVNLTIKLYNSKIN